MRKLKGLIGICVLSMMYGTAIAQVQIVIDNQTIPTEDIQSIVILPNSNLISVTTNIPYVVTPQTVGDSVAITSFVITPGTVLAGDAATLSWETANADSCTATGGVGGWEGSTITIPGGSKSITTSVTGSPSFTLTCNGTEPDDTATRSVVLNVNPANAINIESFTASPGSILEGGTTTLSWVTENAASCTPSGGTGGWNAVDIAVIGLASGSTDITASSVGSYVFTLTCLDADGGQDVATANVTVETASSCETPTLSGSTVDWSDLWGVNFPGPVYSTENIYLAKYGYKAIKFNTGDILDDGEIIAVENTATPGTIIGAFSECPGDFDVVAACDYVWGLGGVLKWSTNDKFRTCKLESNKTYYFNITFTDGVDPTESTCNNTPCVATMQHRNY